MFTRAFRITPCGQSGTPLYLAMVSVFAILAMAACNTVNSAATQVQNICTEAAPLVPLAGPMAVWITGSCTAASVVKLASDSNGIAWLKDVFAKAKAVAGKS
jgi:hypothetical protein